MNSLIDRKEPYYQFYIFNKIFFFYNNLLKPLLEIELYDKIGIYNIFTPLDYTCHDGSVVKTLLSWVIPENRTQNHTNFKSKKFLKN